MKTEPGRVTELLRRMREGDSQAAEQLLPLVLNELRRLAGHYMRNERVGHTLQPTALVNEAYLRLAKYENLDWQSRSHFIGVAASVMRQVLVDHARRKRAEKRGGGKEIVELDEGRDAMAPTQSVDLMELDKSLNRLRKMNERHSKVVELRYFGGLSVEETAEVLGVSPITVKRDWTAARAWLRIQLQSGGR